MIKLFYMDIGCDCEEEKIRGFYEMLPKERQGLVDRLKNRELAKKKILAGIFMQYGLSRTLEIPMREIEYTYGEQGKPYLKLMNRLDGKKLQEIDFNLSHSGRYAVLAVSDGAVGIDVERIKKNRLSVAKRCFHEREYEDILRMPDEESRERRFLEYWTMKEAYVKYCGEGLKIPLNSFLIERMDNGISYVKDEVREGQEAFFVTFQMEDPSYFLSVCSSHLGEVKGVWAERNREDEQMKEKDISDTRIKEFEINEISLEEIWLQSLL